MCRLNSQGITRLIQLGNWQIVIVPQASKLVVLAKKYLIIKHFHFHYMLRGKIDWAGETI